tara:strand:- start:1198 stop:2325 length:1128 start_codon:yes stop_codon:yes gene_type:complete
MERSNSVNNELNEDDIERYKRHISLKEIGLNGQKKLKNSSVLFIGAGGLGSSAILYASAAGIGKIGIIDDDFVEKSNLQRQVIHNINELGKNKTDSAAKKILELNPNCDVKIFTERLNTKNVLQTFKDFDIVCDCSDNFGTRYLVNDACIILSKPYIFGSVQGFEGHLSVFNLKKNSPTLRDLIPVPPQNNLVPSCDEFGVIGVSTGLIGILQTNEIIKIILNKGNILDGKILVFNLLDMSMKKLNLQLKMDKNIIDLKSRQKDYLDEDCLNNISVQKISYFEFKKIYKNNCRKIMILDVREKDEFNKFSIQGSISLPLSLLNKKSSFEFIRKNSFGKEIYTICQKGIRSEKASKILIKERIKSITVEGGIDGIR